MKIVHICMTQYSDGWTYQENLLTKYHLLAGNEVTVITSMYHYVEGSLVKDTKHVFMDVNGVKVVRLEKKSDGFMKKMPTYDMFYKTLCSEKPDIIFSHGCQYRDVSLLCKYIKKYPKVKLFVDNHADFTNSATNFFSKEILHKIIWKYYAQKILPFAKKFWGVLPARVDFLINVYGLPKEKCELLVMGADDELVMRSDNKEQIRVLRKQYGIEDCEFLIVTGGKIDKAKLQTELLIKSIIGLDDSRIKLLIFGSVEDEIKDRIMKYIDGNKIIYAGWITPEQSYDYFSAADLVVFPGRHSVFWEQVAGQGKPMVCKRWRGTNHIDVGGNVVFIENDDETAIRNILNYIITDSKKYESMLSVARDRAIKFFSYNEIAKYSIKCENEDYEKEKYNCKSH